MFRNRSFRVKLLKDEDSDISINPPTDYNELVETVAKNVISGLLVYIGADTIRKVVIYTVSAKI